MFGFQNQLKNKKLRWRKNN